MNLGLTKLNFFRGWNLWISIGVLWFHNKWDNTKPMKDGVWGILVKIVGQKKIKNIKKRRDANLVEYLSTPAWSVVDQADWPMQILRNLFPLLICQSSIRYRMQYKTLLSRKTIKMIFLMYFFCLDYYFFVVCHHHRWLG